MNNVADLLAYLANETTLPIEEYPKNVALLYPDDTVLSITWSDLSYSSRQGIRSITVETMVIDAKGNESAPIGWRPISDVRDEIASKLATFTK